MNIIRKVNQLYNQQPVNRKISIVFITSALIVITILSVSFAVQYFNIKRFQEEFPNKYFSTINKISLESISKKTKDIMLEIINYRISLISFVKNNLINNNIVQIPNHNY